MKKIELDTPIEDMSEADLRETFSDVMEAHEANVAEYAEVSEEAEKAAEYAETIEELEADVSEAAGYFAAKASEVTKLDTGVLVDRFSIDELVELAAQADEETDEAEFSEEEDVEDEPEEDASVFAEKPSKAPVTSAQENRRDAAKDRLSRIGGISLD